MAATQGEGYLPNQKRGRIRKNYEIVCKLKGQLRGFISTETSQSTKEGRRDRLTVEKKDPKRVCAGKAIKKTEDLRATMATQRGYKKMAKRSHVRMLGVAKPMDRQIQGSEKRKGDRYYTGTLSKRKSLNAWSGAP